MYAGEEFMAIVVLKQVGLMQNLSWPAIFNLTKARNRLPS
jgi:hypothetical protein